MMLNQLNPAAETRENIEKVSLILSTFYHNLENVPNYVIKQTNNPEHLKRILRSFGFLEEGDFFVKYLYNYDKTMFKKYLIKEIVVRFTKDKEYGLKSGYCGVSLHISDRKHSDIHSADDCRNACLGFMKKMC